MTHRPDGSAVCEDLVHGEIEPVVAEFHRGAVERALLLLQREPAARRAAVGPAVDALLEEEQLHPAVRGRLERRRPADRGAAVPAGLLPPAGNRLPLLLSTPL